MNDIKKHWEETTEKVMAELGFKRVDSSEEPKKPEEVCSGVISFIGFGDLARMKARAAEWAKMYKAQQANEKKEKGE